MDTSGPAFPETSVSKGSLGSMNTNMRAGLTKREYMATMAMQGLIARTSDRQGELTVAMLATSYADALLERLREVVE